jgi:predicted DNA-binding mobile mystery protein A
MNKREIVRNQLDTKLLSLQNSENVVVPASGWVYAFRYALNMSLRQLGQKLFITPQSVREIEEREKKGTVSLNVLRQVASALDMKFVYGFVPEEKTLAAMVKKRATLLAEKIVERSSIQMSLEDQTVSEESLKEAIDEMAEEFIKDLPKLLWD